MRIAVNGSEIPAAVIAAEAQNHPADDPMSAWRAAAKALVVKALLSDEAKRLSIAAKPLTDAQGRPLAEDDAIIETLLEQEVTTPRADDATCRRYYDSHPERFKSADLVEASHILFAARREDKDAYERAVVHAADTIAELTEHPDRFETLASARSACPSAGQGGSLGQLGPGQTVPEFETFLFNLEPGQLCPVPVKTRYGAHVLRIGRKALGAARPYESVRQTIADYLEEASWRQAVAQYIAILADQADIEGISLQAE